MANYILLESIQLTSTTASVVFDNIPQSGYTDLKIVMSTRTIASGYGTDMTIAFNGSTSNFEGRRIYGYSGSAYSDTQTNVSGLVVGASATASTFSVNELYISNYLSSNYKSYSIDAVSENNSSTAYLLEISANRWLNTAAINSVTFAVASSSFDVGSSFSLYGIAATGTTPAVSPYASGGDIVVTDGTYWIHTFLSTGTFTPAKALTCDYLVVAGGGSGGGQLGGGGGAGGLRSTVTTTGGGGSLESAIAASSGTSYTVTVGAGAAGVVASLTGSNGSNSTFSTVTSIGGGGGGNNSTPSTGAGNSGGSGGGNGEGSLTTNTGTANQGYKGGSAYDLGSSYGAGGGGGAGATGANGTSSVGGNGGAGVSVAISGSSVTYAGGGGGSAWSSYTPGSGGSGGGGNGGQWDFNNGTSGTANTGGGGGGQASNSGVSKSGGSGIVIIRYAV